MPPDHTHFQAIQGGEVRPDAEHLPGGPQEHADPVGAIDQPGGIQERRAGQGKARSDPRQVRFGHRSGARQGRRGERQPSAVTLHTDQAGRAFLGQDPVMFRDATGVEPRVRRPQRGMPGIGELLRAGEDEDPAVGIGMRRRQEECGLRKVRPVGEGCICSVLRSTASTTTASGCPGRVRPQIRPPG